MRNTKKFLAGILAMASVASCASMMTNAEEVDVVEVSYETLAAPVVANDGTEIPAGSTAVSVFISNNAGFQGDSLTFNVGNAVALTNADGVPVVDNGEVLGKDAVVSSAQNSSTFVVAYVATEEKDADGELFTFYLSDPADVTVSETAETAVTNHRDSFSTLGTKKFWIIGDVNGNFDVSVDDAVYVMNAVTKSGGRMAAVEDLDEDLSTYFPDLAIPSAICADGNQDGWLMDGTVQGKYSDVQQILNYYSQTASGLEYVRDVDVDDADANKVHWYIGDTMYYKIENGQFELLQIVE